MMPRPMESPTPLTDDAGGRFAVDLNTGIVTVADGSLFNREANASHVITVRATSADGSFTDQSFTIGINDVDEFDVGTLPTPMPLPTRSMKTRR